MWNASASAERMRALIEIIERHATAVGRDASRIEKSVLLPPSATERHPSASSSFAT